MSTSGRPVPGNGAGWLYVALLPMVASQIVRLQQAGTAEWIIADYSGRIGTLALLLLIPAARKIAYHREPLAISLWEVALWILAILFCAFFIGARVDWFVYSIFPDTRLGHYPTVSGFLRLFDILFGLALVAYSEEVVFRRIFGQLLENRVRSPGALVVATALLFGAYHWWTGIANILNAVIFGILAMLFYRRAQALWPVVLTHYLDDVIRFGFLT